MPSAARRRSAVCDPWRRTAAGDRSGRRDPLGGAQGRRSGTRGVRRRTRVQLGCVPRRQRQPGPLRRAQAGRPAHPVGQAGRRGRQGARGLCRQSQSRQCDADHAAAARPRGPVLRMVRGVVRRGRDGRRLSGRARRAAGVDRRPHEAPPPACVARNAGVPGRPLRGQPVGGAQEIEKLGLLLPEGELAHDAVEQAIANVARYDVFQLSESWLAGDATRVLRILRSLQAEGDAPVPAIWQLVEDVHAIAAVHTMVRGGTPVSAAVRNARVWGKRQGALERAVGRVAPASVPAAAAGACAKLDALSKGLGRGDAWDALTDVALPRLRQAGVHSGVAHPIAIPDHDREEPSSTTFSSPTTARPSSRWRSSNACGLCQMTAAVIDLAGVVHHPSLSVLAGNPFRKLRLAPTRHGRADIMRGRRAPLRSRTVLLPARRRRRAGRRHLATGGGTRQRPAHAGPPPARRSRSAVARVDRRPAAERVHCSPVSPLLERHVRCRPFRARVPGWFSGNRPTVH